MHAREPSDAAYCPALQLSHSSTVDATEYLPTPHAVHALAPERFPLFVIDPFGHDSHSDCVDAFE